MGILSVILAILAIACAFLATMLFGTTGCIITVVLAVIAIALAVFKRVKTKKGGIAGIIVSALAIILAFSMAGFWSNSFKELHNKAVELKPDGLWAQASEDSTNGLMGIINKLPQDEASLNALVDEMNELTKLTETK